MASISIEGASRTFPDGTRALDGVSLAVADGEFLVLVGPSGCGKSTLLRAVAGLERLDSGRVLIGDADVTGKPAGERDIAMVFQNYALYPQMTVRDNIEFGLKSRRMSEQRAARARRRCRPGCSDSDRCCRGDPRNCPVASCSASPWAAPSRDGRRRS